MNVWFVIALPAWMIIIITAAARLHDLGRDKWGLRYHVRRIGLTCVGSIAAVMMLTPFTADSWMYAEPSWRQAMIGWSWALVWLTTDGMPPWYDYILGVHRRTEAWRHLSFRERLRAEWTALRESFRPDRNKDRPYAGPERRERKA